MPSTSDTSSSPTKSKSIGKTAIQPQPVHANAADRVSNEGGKRMYKMADGKTVELPHDMTAEDAAKLEAEGNAAKKKLGKGPQPKPVPDVKSKAKGKEKKSAAKSVSKKKKSGEKIGGHRKLAHAELHGEKIAFRGKVGAWLMAKGAPAIHHGETKLQQLKHNEQQHDTAGDKLSQTQKAVVPPSMEGQSMSNAGQVAAVDSKSPPQPSEADAKQALQQAIQDNIPQNIEDVDNFRRDNKAGHMSAAAALVVQTDKNAVGSTFGDMKQTPPPVKSDVKPEALPPEEVAPVTPKMNLGTNTIAPLQKEHTDVSNYTKEADAKLQEEGVSQEQLDMVDSGDLAEANKEKKGMEKKAKTEPQAIQQFATQQNQAVDKALQQEESKGKEAIKNQRKQKLGATAQKQKDTKSAIEKKREEVAGKINLIYSEAQSKVTKKLNDLEAVAMKRFDDGNAKATKEFEDNVKKELDAFKDDRYSGFWGWAKKAKDWLLGMDDLPEVKAIFDRNRATFVDKVNKLVDDITLDNKKVIQECKDELANARKTIQEYVSKLGPELRDAGKKAQEEMNGKLDELDNFVAKKEQELQDKLKDKQKAAIKAIDEKIEKMKEEMSGALSKLANLLLLAAKKFFIWTLEKFGYSPDEIMGIINKGAAVLKAIFTQPIRFVKNLMNAAITGFQNFGKNFLNHLKNALFEWLTGSLEGLLLPQTWDFKGILSIALQMIGVSYQHIRTFLVNLMGEKVVSSIEKTFTLVKALITEGPMAAWEQLKEMAGEMKDAFIDAVKDFIKSKIIEQAIQWLVSIFIPGAGIIKAIIGIYDTIVFFVQKAKQIFQMISNFLGSIGEIAMGNIGAAADAMENGLARGLTLVISFLAQLLHLNGITDKIKNAIQKIRAKVDAVIQKVAKWIAEKAKKLFNALTGKKDKTKDEKAAVSASDPNPRLDAAKKDAEAILTAPKTTPEKIREQLPALKNKHQLQEATLEENDGLYDINIKINPTAKTRAIALTLTHYPGSGLDPLTRTVEELLEDLDEKTPLPGEKTKKNAQIRAAMAENAIRALGGGHANSVAKQLLNHHRAQDIKALSDISVHEGKGHTILRHVLNGSGQIKNKQDLALRVLLNEPGNPQKAGAFNTEGSATTYTNKAMKQRIATDTWPVFRKAMLSPVAINIVEPINPKGVAYVPETGVAPGVITIHGGTMTVVPKGALLPLYLSGQIYEGMNAHGGVIRKHIFSDHPSGGTTTGGPKGSTAAPTDVYQGEPVGVRKLYPGDKNKFVDPTDGKKKPLLDPPLVQEVNLTEVKTRFIPDGAEDGGYSINSSWPQ